MKNVFIFLFLTLFLLVVVAVVVTPWELKTAFNRRRIGETVVICGDTLTIDDYNASYKYYILSNGLIYECK